MGEAKRKVEAAIAEVAERELERLEKKRAINPLRSRERVIVPDRRAPTKAEKTSAWNRMNGTCWWCGKPVARDGLDVEWDHEIPRELSADDSADNLAPLHVRCHAQKTSGEDRPRIDKARRQSKLTEPKIKKQNGFRRPPGMKFNWITRRYERCEP